MSIFRIVVVIVVAVALLPNDPNTRSELAQKAAFIGQETATFCQRNPHTCAAGQELWSAFVQKAQYGLTLAAEFASNYSNRARSDTVPHPSNDSLQGPENMFSAPPRGSLAPVNASGHTQRSSEW